MSSGRFIKTYDYLQTMLPTLVGVEVWRDEREEFDCRSTFYELSADGLCCATRAFSLVAFVHRTVELRS